MFMRERERLLIETGRLRFNCLNEIMYSRY